MTSHLEGPVDLGLVGQMLEDVRVGYAMIFTFSAGREATIENTIRLAGRSGRVEVELAADQ